MYRSSVSMRGQITIPKALRDKFRLKPGDEMLISEAGGRIVLIPRLPDAVSRGRGFLARHLPGISMGHREGREDTGDKPAVEEPGQGSGGTV